MGGLVWLGVLSAAVFVVAFLIDGATRPGYVPTYHPVSALALGPRGWIQTASFVVCGGLMAAAAFGVQSATRNLWLAVAIGFVGVMQVLSGVFRMDPMRGYPPGTLDTIPTETSLRHRLHDWAGVALFLGVPAAAFIAAFVLEGQVWSVYSALSGAVVLVLLVLFGHAWEDDSPRAGFIQRVMLVVGWVWLAALFVHLT